MWLVVWGIVLVTNRAALGEALHLVFLHLGLPWMPSLVYLVALYGIVSSSTFLVKRWCRDVVRLDMTGGL